MKPEFEKPQAGDAATQQALHLFVVLMRCCSSVTEQTRQDITRTA